MFFVQYEFLISPVKPGLETGEEQQIAITHKELPMQQVTHHAVIVEPPSAG